MFLLNHNNCQQLMKNKVKNQLKIIKKPSILQLNFNLSNSLYENNEISKRDEYHHV